MIRVWYHAACWDGFGAAWAVRDAFRGTDEKLEYTPLQYGDELPAIDPGDIIYFVDFSAKPEELDRLLQIAEKVLILDHHKTALEHLQSYVHPRLEKQIDLQYSGAVMAWTYFRHEMEAIPTVLRYVQDRDLWKFALPSSKAVNAYIRSLPMSFEEWDEKFLFSKPNWNAIAAEGDAILREQERIIQDHVLHAKPVKIGGHLALAVNATVYFSEIAGELAKISQTDFGAAYFIRSDGKFQYSLRSRGNFDVSDVAKSYGGGGHRNAAGFESDVVIK